MTRITIISLTLASGETVQYLSNARVWRLHEEHNGWNVGKHDAKKFETNDWIYFNDQWQRVSAVSVVEGVEVE